MLALVHEGIWIWLIYQQKFESSETWVSDCYDQLNGSCQICWSCLICMNYQSDFESSETWVSDCYDQLNGSCHVFWSCLICMNYLNDLNGDHLDEGMGLGLQECVW